MLFDTVRRLCQSQNITVAELERKVKLGNGTIRKWNVTSPSVDRLSKVADYFGVTTDFLLGRDALSAQCQEIAYTANKLSPAKLELVKQYITMLQAS